MYTETYTNLSNQWMLISFSLPVDAPEILGCTAPLWRLWHGPPVRHWGFVTFATSQQALDAKDWFDMRGIPSGPRGTGCISPSPGLTQQPFFQEGHVGAVAHGPLMEETAAFVACRWENVGL